MKSPDYQRRVNFYTQRTVEFDKRTNSIKLIDQTALPTELKFEYCRTVPEIIRAIQTMQIRGAPAIGVAGAMGVALSFKAHRKAGRKLIAKVESDALEIKD